MKLLAPLALVLLCASPLCAQSYILKDGHILNQADVVAKNGSLVQHLGAGADVTYNFDRVVRLDWPKPPEIDEADDLLSAGKAAEALTKIIPIYEQFSPFPSIPGSWWSDAAALRMQAILAQNQLPAAESAAREIIATAADVDGVKAAQLVLAEIQLKQHKPDIADAMLDLILKQHASSDIEARALVLRGDIAYAKHDYEKALEFYLQIPVFFGTHDDLMPAALLGSARAYKGYGDNAHAERAYLDLINSYPTSAEATAAKAESHL